MPLTPGQRITLIRECATLLDKEEWADIDLILGQHDLPISDDWQGGSARRDYVIAMIQHADDDKLQGLHEYLTSESDNSDPGQSPFKSERLRVFFSHLAAHRELVGETARALGRYGVDAFVAHDDIEPSKEWQNVIEAALGDCDAMVIFLHDGFQRSRWCDQEVGWTMGRRRPILPLNFGLQPYGFMGKLQSQTISDAQVTVQSTRVADAIALWLANTPSVHGRLAASLAEGLVSTYQWDFTRKIVPLMDTITSYSTDDLNRIEEAAKGNVDIYDCALPGGETGAMWAKRFVESRRGPVVADPWSTAPPSFSYEQPPF